MKRILVLGLFLVHLAFLAHADLTETNGPTAPASTNALAPLINYALKAGKPGNAESYIVQNLNLSSKDVPVMQSGWKSKDHLDHLAAVSVANHDDVLLLVFNENADGVCWLTSRSGQIRSTVAFSRSSHTSHVVANELDSKAFESEKKFLLARVFAATHQRQ